MKRVAVFLLVLLLFAFASVTGVTLLRGASVTPVQEVQDVVLLRCTQTEHEPIGVAQSSSSPGAPEIKADTSCAEALASLLNAGFKIESARGDDIFIYTLVRQRFSRL